MIRRVRTSNSRRIQYPPRHDDYLWDLWTQDQRVTEWPVEMTQEQYIEILFNDCGFDPTQRRAWLRAEYGRAYPDELPWDVKSKIIDRLKSLKAAQREAAQPRADEESGLLPGMEDC